MDFTLSQPNYSPRLLAEALNHIVKAGFIRKQIAAGKLPAKRLGGKNLLIRREDAEAWLANLPSATAPTNLRGPVAKEKREKRERAKAKTESEVAAAYRRRQQMAAFRARQKP